MKFYLELNWFHIREEKDIVSDPIFFIRDIFLMVEKRSEGCGGKKCQWFNKKLSCVTFFVIAK